MLGLFSKMIAFLAQASLPAAGVSIAVGSASFAAYMFVHAPSDPYFGGMEHLALFAQPARIGRPDADAPRAPDLIARSVPMDMTPIGTIVAKPSSEGRSGGKAPAAALPILAGHALLSLIGSRALIQSPAGARIHAMGEELPGVGVLRSIEQFDGGWSVVTDKGRILERRSGVPAAPPQRR